MKKDYLEKLNGIDIDKTLGYLLLLGIWIVILFWILNWHPSDNISEAKSIFNSILTDENDAQKSENNFLNRIDLEKVQQGTELLLNTKYSPYMKNYSSEVWNDFQRKIFEKLTNHSKYCDKKNEDRFVSSNKVLLNLLLNSLKWYPTNETYFLTFQYLIQSGNFSLISKIFNIICVNDKTLNENDKSLHHIYYAIGISNFLDGKIEKAKSYLLKSRTRMNVSDISDTVDYLLLYISSGEKDEDTINKVTANTSNPVKLIFRGYYYLSEKRLEKALEDFELAYQLLKGKIIIPNTLTKNTILYLNLINGMSEVYFQKKDYKKVFSIINEGKHIFSKGILSRYPCFRLLHLKEIYYNIKMNNKVESINLLRQFVNDTDLCKVDNFCIFTEKYHIRSMLRTPLHVVDTLIEFIKNNYEKELSILSFLQSLKGIQLLSIYEDKDAYQYFTEAIENYSKNNVATHYVKLLNKINTFYDNSKIKIIRNRIISFKNPIIISTIFSLFVKSIKAEKNNQTELYVKYQSQVRTLQNMYRNFASWFLLDSIYFYSESIY